jgi:hypothetical protein
MSTRLIRLAAVVAILATVRALVSGPSELPAGIVAMSGTAVEIAAPPSVVGGALESDTVTSVFMEQPFITLETDVPVVVLGPGRVMGRVERRPGVIASGTTFTSYMLHQDRIGEEGSVNLKGSITFDGPILGLILTSAGLDDTDFLLGSPTTLYPEDTFQRRLELNRDFVKINAAQTKLIYNLSTGHLVDQIRILVAAPVPGPASLAVFAFAGLIGGRRRRA